MDRSTDPITEFTSKKHPQFLAAGVGKISIFLIFSHETLVTVLELASLYPLTIVFVSHSWSTGTWDRFGIHISSFA